MAGHDQSVLEILSRLQDLEARIEDIAEFALEHNSDLETSPYKAEYDESNLVDDAGRPSKLRKKTFYWRDSWLMAMHTITSKLVLYENGLWESECDMKDESKHRKYGNRVVFRLKNETGGLITSLGGWLGNFSSGEQKTYTGSGHSGAVHDMFDEIGGKVKVSRYWEAWER